MVVKKTSKKSGVYETLYGNTVKYTAGAKTGYDMDMGERIPVEMIDFNARLR